MEMLAAQAAHQEGGSTAGDEGLIVSDMKLSDTEKRTILQKHLHMAASNGDVERVQELVHGKATKYIDVNGADEEGTAPLIYASCFVSKQERQVVPITNTNFDVRVTRMLYRLYLVLEHRLIGRTRTNGQR